MDLLQKILECKDEHINLIVNELINEANNKAVRIEKLGFLDYEKSNSVFYGFIPLSARIKYANLNVEDYGMNSTDFIYEFIYFIRKFNINNKLSLIYSLERFINDYFGYPGKMDREAVFNDVAWQTTTTDEEYFKALENNKISDLKGKGAAQCTEKSALAQQILSLLGLQIYYCMGCVDLGDREEAHCFNIVKRKDDYALLDYSMPISSYDEDGIVKELYPFVGVLTNSEFSDFVNNGSIKEFDNYDFINNKIELLDNKRKYVVGRYKMGEQIAK